jgi:hypothetical protein
MQFEFFLGIKQDGMNLTRHFFSISPVKAMN